ncbi:MAG TPA: hypothetical protein VFQ53_31585 [Kofleriaceae bacterium]|nr:hypothetical protein [Kofleriaceae bacterium]
MLVLACAATPRAHRFAVPADVGSLVVDDRSFAPLARPLRADVEASLRGSLDVTARKDRLFILALLDALDDHWPEALASIDRIAALETDPRQRAMTGLTIRVWADARARGADTPDGFRAALERALNTLPLALVHDDLQMLRAMGQAFTPEACRALVAQAVHAEHGTISLEDARTIAFQRYAVKRLAPVGAVIDQVLGARGIELPSE